VKLGPSAIRTTGGPTASSRLRIVFGPLTVIRTLNFTVTEYIKKLLKYAVFEGPWLSYGSAESPDWNTFMKHFNMNFKHVPQRGEPKELFDDIEDSSELHARAVRCRSSGASAWRASRPPLNQ
jgi:hypothetical protein